MRSSLCSLTMIAVLLAGGGCDDTPSGPNQPAFDSQDPYAPGGGRPTARSGPKPGMSEAGGTGGTGSAAADATAAVLARVEGKLDETLKLLYDLSIANDQRFARLEARLERSAAALQTPAGPEPTPPAGIANIPPAGRPAPEWTAEQKKWIVKYTAKFEGVAPQATGQPESDLIGGRLPATRFLALTGGAFDLNDYAKQKQRVVLVILRGFSGSICLYCSSQTLALSRAEAEFKKRNAQVVLIYPGQADTVPMFLEAVNNLDPKTDVPFPIGMDVDLSAVHQYRIRGELAKPTSIIADENGVVRYAHVGASLTDRPTVKELLDELDKLK